MGERKLNHPCIEIEQDGKAFIGDLKKYPYLDMWAFNTINRQFAI